jgi:hypothetical protein
VITTRIAAGILLLAAASTAVAQELEPRVYLASPVGTNIVIVGAATSRGDVVFDPTLPIKDVRARVGSLVFAYYRSFDFFGRSASLGGGFPLVRASVNGLLSGEEARLSRLGQGDASTRLTVNLAGSPAMDTAAFVKSGRHANLGASVLLLIPIGQYDSTRIVNIGANRWSVKPELGLSLPFGRRGLIDAYAGVWLFGKNDDYVGGIREQEPMLTTQFHVSYNLSRRAWAAFDVTFYAGGGSRVNGAEPVERVSNTRLGATLSLPIASRHALKAAFSTGARVRLGSDFNTFSVAWSYAWGRGL